MRLFWNSIASGTDDSRLTLTEVLLAPLLLPHRINHIQNHHVPNKLRPRLQTPGPLSSARLSTLNQAENVQEIMKVEYNENLQVSESAISLRHDKAGKIIKQFFKKSIDPDISTPVQDFYEEIKVAISRSNFDAYSHLSKRPEMKLLESDKLFDLLDSSLDRYTDSNNSRRLFVELFKDVVDGIVPEIYPNDFEKFIVLATKRTVPSKLFSLACKHLKLLSNDSLNELVCKIELKSVWAQLGKVGISDFKRFNFMIIEIAANLENSEDLVRLDYVRKILSTDKSESLGKTYLKTLVKVKFIYMTTYLLSALKSIGPQNESSKMRKAINNLFKIGQNNFKMDIGNILELMEPVWKIVLPQITPEQAEPFGRFMRTLHGTILDQINLPFIPSEMTGMEDLYLYVTNNLINLTQARLKYCRSNRMTKGQLLTLLIATKFSSKNDPNMILVILASIQINPRIISAQEFESLGLRGQMALKIFFTIPKRFDGEICTPNAELKQTESIAWKLPADLFISENPDKNIFILTDMLLNLPRLFLYRVFGLPLMNFAEVGSGMNEIPEMKELVDISNFFLERWCSNNSEAPYPRVKVVL